MKIVEGYRYTEEVKTLLNEYVAMLGRDLSFQSIEDELNDIEIKYGKPHGCLLVAVDDDEAVVGMIAYQHMSDDTCEMKRLYVKSQARGMNLGDKLIENLLGHARKAGYKRMVLDTITPLQAAIHLYEKHGFVECEPYYFNPMNDVIYFEKEL